MHYYTYDTTAWDSFDLPVGNLVAEHVLPPVHPYENYISFAYDGYAVFIDKSELRQLIEELQKVHDTLGETDQLPADEADIELQTLPLIDCDDGFELFDDVELPKKSS